MSKELKNREEVVEQLIVVYKECVDEHRTDYAEQAESIISEWEESV